MLYYIKSFLHIYYDKRPLPLRDKILFIHIPKNGGTSLIKALNISKVTHIKASEYTNKEGQQSELTKKYSFSVVRNPYERFISLYNYARMEISYYHNNIEPEKSKYGKHMDYEILKNSTIGECARLLVEGKLKHDVFWNHWEPQYTWVVSEGKIKVKKIYKLEDLNELVFDFKKYFDEEVLVPTLNKSTMTNNFEELDIETKRIIQEYYYYDFKYFNYPF
jgi:hypothetical protein